MQAIGAPATSQRAIVKAYTIMALLYCAASTWLYYNLIDIAFLGHVHIASFVVIAINYGILQRTGNYRAATHTILAIGTLVVSSQFALGGWNGTGYLWTFAYLPYAFFLATPKLARLWVGVLIAVDAMLVVLGQVHVLTLAYAGVQLVIFTASLGIFLIGMFLFQMAVLHSEALAESRARQLAQANDRLVASEAELAKAQELAHVGSWNWEPSRPSMSASRELLRIVGMQGQTLPADLDGLLRFVHAEDRGKMRAAVAASLADGRPLDIEARILRRDGVQRLGHWLARAERDHTGAVERLAGTTQDVTELREAEEARRRAARQLQDFEALKEINTVRTQFMNTAAHELSTPLTPITVELKLLQSEAFQLDPSRQKQAISIVDRNVRRLSLLVKDLLDGARLQASQLALQRVALDLSASAREAVRAQEGVAAERGIMLGLDAPSDRWVFADGQRISQVFDNVLNNALKFTPRGGRVTVRIERASGGVAARVQDTGIGLSAANIERLFQPFSQVHDTMQSTRAGSGLGLYIAKGIVEAHGGSIGVESSGPEKGTTFWFVLPGTQAPDDVSGKNRT